MTNTEKLFLDSFLSRVGYDSKSNMNLSVSFEKFNGYDDIVTTGNFAIKELNAPVLFSKKEVVYAKKLLSDSKNDKILINI